LEVLAHYAVLPLDFVITAVRIPDRIKVADAPVSRLPANWNDPSSSVEITQRIGARWIASGRSCVLLVPSAVVAKEWNYVLNVAHPDFMFIEFGVPEPFRFDPRLR
jgi:RES domain-containing protein